RDPVQDLGAGGEGQDAEQAGRQLLVFRLGRPDDAGGAVVGHDAPHRRVRHLDDPRLDGGDGSQHPIAQVIDPLHVLGGAAAVLGAAVKLAVAEDLPLVPLVIERPELGVIASFSTRAAVLPALPGGDRESGGHPFLVGPPGEGEDLLEKDLLGPPLRAAVRPEGEELEARLDDLAAPGSLGSRGLLDRHLRLPAEGRRGRCEDRWKGQSRQGEDDRSAYVGHGGPSILFPDEWTQQALPPCHRADRRQPHPPGHGGGAVRRPPRPRQADPRHRRAVRPAVVGEAVGEAGKAGRRARPGAQEPARAGLNLSLPIAISSSPSRRRRRDMAFLLAVILSFGPALACAATVYWLDRYEKEPKVLLGAVFG